MVTAALTNGSENTDTNSSKAFIGRVGIDRGWFAAGVSAKVQDGVGSNGLAPQGNQKEFDSFYGFDAMFHWGNWTLSGEGIFDEYGFRQPGFNPDDIFWARSIYFRDLYRGVPNKPLTGFGYYVNLIYASPRWLMMFNYGDFFNFQQVGIAAHDVPVHRGLAKVSYHFTPRLEAYAIGLVENTVPLPFQNLVRKGWEVIAGWQFSL